MSRARAYKQETLDVMDRFFQAVEALIERGDIRGIQTYCRLHDIDKRHFYAQRDDLGRGLFEIAWLLPLVSDHGVSMNWLMFGKGAMFRPSASKPVGK
ncbi:MAG: helix-turn-helix domain containing protein [Bacteroidales bacterium]|nr:helix-turn-helix domain containing protein [Bacteroidales bacterium]